MFDANGAIREASPHEFLLFGYIAHAQTTDGIIVEHLSAEHIFSKKVNVNTN